MAHASADPQILRLLCVCSCASMASMRLCDAMLPGLAATFRVTPGDAAQTIAAFAVAYGLSQLVYGPLGDRHGKLRVIGLATLGCTLGSVGSALATSLPTLVASRALSGAAAAGIIPLAMAWIGDQVSVAERQEVLARLLGATVLGMVFGQWGGGLVADAGSWRVAFAMMAVAFLGAGSLLLRAGGGSSAGGRTSGLGFHEVLSRPWARAVLMVTFVEGALAFGALAFIATHLHSRHGLSMSMAGAVVALYGVGGLAYSRNARRILARIDVAGLAFLGASCLAGSLAAIAYAPAWPWTLPACLLAGFGFYALHNTLQANATQMAPTVRGTAMACFACVLFLGQSVGVTATALLADRWTTGPVFVVAAVGLLVTGTVFGRLLLARSALQHGSI